MNDFGQLTGHHTKELMIMMIMIMMRTIVAVVVSVCLAGQLGKRPGSAAQAHLPSQKPSNRPKILSRRFSVVRATRDKNFCEKTQ